MVLVALANVKDVPGAEPLRLRLQGASIWLENVNFAYHPDRLIFRNLSFTVLVGKKVAIVGPSGCGKSTVFRLLYRFYDANSGTISIDGQDITRTQHSDFDPTSESCRKTIRKNIREGWMIVGVAKAGVVSTRRSGQG